MAGVVSMWVSRPRLAGSTVVGLIAGVAAWRLAPGLGVSGWVIAGWDVLCITFLSLIAWMVRDSTPAEIRDQAAREDEGRGAILFLTLIAAVVSLAAVALELTEAKSGPEREKVVYVAIAFGTVALSWLMVQVIFALHYAHEYYSALPDTGGDSEGLAFPGDDDPDYWDFLHFSLIIGVASQTADVAFTAKGLRRLGSIHSLVAFSFNTVIVALTINLLAGLF